MHYSPQEVKGNVSLARKRSFKFGQTLRDTHASEREINNVGLHPLL
jgi:hypothetical protein